MKMKKVNWAFLCFAFVFFAVLTAVSFLGAFSYEDGHTDAIDTMERNLFMVMRFPTHTLLWKFITINDSLVAVAFPLGLLINVIFYALMAERLSYLLKKMIRTKPNLKG